MASDDELGAPTATGAAMDDDFEYESDGQERGDTPPKADVGAADEHEEALKHPRPGRLGAPLGKEASATGAGSGGDDGDDGAEEDPEDEEDGGVDDGDEEEGQATGAGRGYNKADYAHLSVGADVRELFEFIDLCKPVDIELEPRFKPFIPEFIPAVGEIDPFLKPPRPDGETERLGITALDEPGKQSDPTVLEMVLRLQSKKANLPMMEVRGIDHADHKPKEVLAWVERIAALHRTSQGTTAVQYSKPMPSIESLMEEWPPEIEQLLEKVRLPTGDIDLDLKQLSRVACAILDIPVHGGNLVESLHVLFTLFSAFKENQFFRARVGDAPSSTGNPLMSSTGGQPAPSAAASVIPPPTQKLTFTPPVQ